MNIVDHVVEYHTQFPIAAPKLQLEFTPSVGVCKTSQENTHGFDTGCGSSVAADNFDICLFFVLKLGMIQVLNVFDMIYKKQRYRLITSILSCVHSNQYTVKRGRLHLFSLFDIQCVFSTLFDAPILPRRRGRQY